MLPADATDFMAYARTKTPVFCTVRDSESEEIVECEVTGSSQTLCLWNRDILPTLSRKYINRTVNPYFRIDYSLPVVELIVPRICEWDGIPALAQGRIYASFDVPNEPLRKWFDALVRWIRKIFVKNPVPWQFGYVGPHAYEWHRQGGLLLPTYLPPLTTKWKDRLLSQLPEK
jgi:hypothetical protein